MPALAAVERLEAWEMLGEGEGTGVELLLAAEVAELLGEEVVVVLAALEVLTVDVNAEGASGGAVS